MNCLIFYLKQESLQIYRLSKSLVLINKISDSSFLNLSQNFENLWQNCWSIISLETEIYFILGQNASFTDTRIVYLWLQSWQMFANFRNLENSTDFDETFDNTGKNEEIQKKEKEERKTQKSKKELTSKQFWVHKLEHNLVLEFLENIKLKELLGKIKLINNHKLLYTKDARIGQTKLNQNEKLK